MVICQFAMTGPPGRQRHLRQRHAAQVHPKLAQRVAAQGRLEGGNVSCLAKCGALVQIS